MTRSATPSTRTTSSNSTRADDRAEIVFGEWLNETLLHGFFCQEENEGAAQIRRCSGGEGRAGRAAMLGELSTAIPTQSGEPRH